MSKLIVRSLFFGAFCAAVIAFPKAAAAAELDCTTGCAFQSFAGAFWVTVDQQSTGTGVIDSFVRISGNTDQVDGHNTSGRKLLNDENSSPSFTRDLKLENVPLVTISGEQYYEFLLDINQEGNDPLLALSQVQICLAGSGGLLTENTCPGGTPVYDMDAVNVDGEDNRVKMNYNLNSGSGSGDLFMYIPVDTLGDDLEQFVYLYSAFGTPEYPEAGDKKNPRTYGNNDGFEEWAVRRCENITLECSGVPLPQVPEPASVLLLGGGLIGLAAALRKRAA